MDVVLKFHSICCLTPAASKMSHPTGALNAADRGLQPSDPIEVVVLYYAQGLGSKQGQMDLGSVSVVPVYKFRENRYAFLNFFGSKP